MSENMGLRPTEKCIKEIQKAFPEGAEVELVFMDDPYSIMPIGMKGIVKGVDGIGTIHVSWENNSTLGVAWNADVVRNVETGVLSNAFWGDNQPW